MLNKSSLHNKYKKKIGKKSNGPVDYMKDIPLTFDMDDIPYNQQAAIIKKNTFSANNKSSDFKKQTSNSSASTQDSDKSQTSSQNQEKPKDVISVMNLESPQGHFTEEKIQSLYQGTHLKGNYQTYDSNSSTHLHSPDLHSEDQS